MKIVILGPSASGKTTLAKVLSEKYELKHYNQDFLLFRYDLSNKDRKKLSNSKRQKIIDDLVNQDSWIFEGIIFFNRLLDAADLIIYIKSGLFACLYKQWKRYFTDEDQRRRFGFFNNLKLSVFIIKQHTTSAISVSAGKKVDKKNVLKKLEKYKNKVIYLKYSNKKMALQAVEEFRNRS